MTNEERDRRVFEVFAQACGLETAERPAALEQACAGDAELRRRVEAMLDADAGNRGAIGTEADIDSFITRQIRLVAPDAAGVDSGLRADSPAVDGEYTILRVIGEGGMGTVYEAEQHEPRRRVAIKAIRPGRITPQMRKRFEYEAQVLARLEHPGIARLYESNTHSEGGRVRAFLAMELVLGEPIDAYVAAHELDLEQRLRLFMKVCDAVAYAHRMGVIHRDLKPANILINADGEPKVLDFGVARTVAAGDKLHATQLTHDGQIVGTLAYMSPEQVEGRAEIDTRTDVYALGVILYKLLTGVQPIDVADANLLVASQRLLTEIPRPIGQHDKRLKGDLETIVARALEKEPAQRYGSVDQLRAEIDRHLAGRPIEARAHSTFYVVRKALWRHRELVGICVLLLGLLTAFGVYAAVQAGRNRRLAVAADEARARATAQAGDLRRLLYFSHIGFAQSALENNDMERAHTLLDGCDAELRAWEWSYLERLCDLSSETTQLNLKRPRYASFTADRSRVAIATLDREVALRDNTGAAGAGGRELSRIELPAGSARAALSRDGHWLAYGAVVDVVTLTDLRSGATRELKAAGPPPDPDASNRLLRVLAFTDDTNTLVAGGVDGVLRVWDVASARIRRSIELGTRLPICMKLSPAGDWAAIGDAGGRLRLFDLRDGTLLRELKGHDAAVWSLALSPDRTRLASGDIDARVIVWDIAAGRSIAHQDTNDGWITAMCFSPDGATVAMGRADSTIRLLHLEDASTAGVLRGHRHAVVHVDWQPDGTLHTISLDGAAKTWNAQSALQVPTITTRQPQSIGLAFDRRGERVLVGGSDGTVRSWTVPPGADEQSVESAPLQKHDGSVLEIVVDRARGRVATTGRDGVVKISSLRDGDTSPPRVIAPQDGGISAIDFSPDGARLIVGSATRVSLWDVERGAKLREYASRTVANELSFAPDGRSFYVGGTDGYVRRWRIDSNEPAGEVQIDPVAGVYDVRVSPDGRTLAAAGDTESVALVDAESLEVIRRLVGHRGAVYGVAFHPAGKRLATCGSDRIIRIWDVETGTELITLRGHRGGIQHVQFSPDGRTLASSSDDGTVKLWRSLPR